jgi:two-component system sensor histidine kinase KdpD
VDHIIEDSGEIDVYVIHGKSENEIRASTVRHERISVDWWPYAMAVAIVLLCSVISIGFYRLRLSEVNLVMVFLAGVAWTAYRFGRAPAILGSFVSVLAIDFLFVRPYFTFAVADAQYIITFIVMLAIGVILGTLTSRLKEQAAHAQRRERRTSSLYELSRQLSSVNGSEFLVIAAGKQIESIFEAEAAIYIATGNGIPDLRYGEHTSIPKDAINAVVAHWVADHDQMAGAGTDTLPNATALFFPLIASQKTLGAIAVKAIDTQRLLAPDQRQLLEACSGQLALALERDQMAMAAQKAQIEAEAEHLRSALLSGVSHDLRTPLAIIRGASSSLLENRDTSESAHTELLTTIVDESRRLSRLLDNLLEMSKLESGTATPDLQWHVLEEIIGAALARTRQDLAHYQVRVDLPSDLPLLHVDGILLEQVFINLFENAARYCPLNSRIEVTARVDRSSIVIIVADNGPGLAPHTEEKVFEKFFRGAGHADARRGSGLGLSICRAVIQLHGGTIIANNRPTGGLQFTIRLPLAKNPPTVFMEPKAVEAIEQH